MSSPKPLDQFLSKLAQSIFGWKEFHCANEESHHSLNGDNNTNIPQTGPVFIQEVHGPHRSPEKPVQINNHICTILWIYPVVEQHFEQTWIPFTQEYIVPNLVEIALVVLEKKMKIRKVYRWTTDNRQSEKLTWSFSSVNLKSYDYCIENMFLWLYMLFH